MLEKVAVGAVRESPKIFREPIYRAHCAVIFAIAQLSCSVIRRTDKQTEVKNITSSFGGGNNWRWCWCVASKQFDYTTEQVRSIIVSLLQGIVAAGAMVSASSSRRRRRHAGCMWGRAANERYLITYGYLFCRSFSCMRSRSGTWRRPIPWAYSRFLV